MEKMNPFAILLVGLCLFASSLSSSYATEVSKLISQNIEPPFNQEVEMLTVRFAPGESSSPHRHNAHTLVYILEGKIDMQLEGGKRVTLTPGDTFYESPEDIHLIASNPSENNDAVFLVVFIKQKGAMTLVPLNNEH